MDAGSDCQEVGIIPRLMEDQRLKRHDAGVKDRSKLHEGVDASWCCTHRMYCVLFLLRGYRDESYTQYTAQYDKSMEMYQIAQSTLPSQSKRTSPVNATLNFAQHVSGGTSPPMLCICPRTKSSRGCGHKRWSQSSRNKHPPLRQCEAAYVLAVTDQSSGFIINSRRHGSWLARTQISNKAWT